MNIAYEQIKNIKIDFTQNSNKIHLAYTERICPDTAESGESSLPLSQPLPGDSYSMPFRGGSVV